MAVQHHLLRFDGTRVVSCALLLSSRRQRVFKANVERCHLAVKKVPAGNGNSASPASIQAGGKAC